GLLNVIQIEVNIAAAKYEVARLKLALLCDHMCQQGIARYVERQPQKHVRRPLIEMARKPARPDVELKNQMTRRQCHLVQLAHVPRAHDEPSGIRVVLDIGYELTYLVDRAGIPRAPRPPLRSIGGAQIAVLIGPFVPYINVVVVEVLDVGVAPQEPQQLV